MKVQWQVTDSQKSDDNLVEAAIGLLLGRDGVSKALQNADGLRESHWRKRLRICPGSSDEGLSTYQVHSSLNARCGSGLPISHTIDFRPYRLMMRADVSAAPSVAPSTIFDAINFGGRSAGKWT